MQLPKQLIPILKYIINYSVKLKFPLLKQVNVNLKLKAKQSDRGEMTYDEKLKVKMQNALFKFDKNLF